MKTERIELLKKIESGGITPEQADVELLNMLIGRFKLLSDGVDSGNSHWTDCYEDASDESQREMEGYQWAINDIIEILNK